MTIPAANPFVAVEPGAEQRLAAGERFARAGHLWGRSEIDALILAFAAGRPLLVRGEAGSGKSQIARAAAAVLGDRPPLVEVIHPRFEALDLLYQVDAVARLADAQVKNLDRTNARYVGKGKLWQAIKAANEASTPPVLLIDEIDKADADVPNALLEVLGNRSFPVPPLAGDHEDSIVRLEPERRMPLVVITTNEERELPPAFVRRCVVLNVSPPDPEKDAEAFRTWLIDRGRVHRHFAVADAARVHAARQVLADRQRSVAEGYAPVGLAEYIDLLTALDDLTRSLHDADKGPAQLEWLDRLSAYGLIKNASQDQRRLPVTPEPIPVTDADPPP